MNDGKNIHAIDQMSTGIVTTMVLVLALRSQYHTINRKPDQQDAVIWFVMVTMLVFVVVCSPCFWKNNPDVLCAINYCVVN